MSYLLTVVGAPSPLLYSLADGVRALTEVAAGEHFILVANSLEALKKDYPHQGGGRKKPVIILSDYPDSTILDLFHEANVPMVVCVDDFRAIARHAILDRGQSGVTAAQFASMGLVNLEPLLRDPPLRSLVVQDGNMTLLSLLADVAQTFGMPSDVDTVRKAVRFLGYGDDEAITLNEFVRKRSQRDPNIPGFGGVGALEEDLLNFIAPQYDVIRNGRGLQAIEWPPYSLMRPEYPDRLTLGPVNLTGPARFIHYGPYLALPRGVWRAEMSVEVKDCLSDNIMGVDACSGRVLALVTAKLPPQGVFDFELEFEVRDPSKPVEIRVRLMTGAIEGELLLRRIQLARPEALSARNGERQVRPLWRTA